MPKLQSMLPAVGLLLALTPVAAAQDSARDYPTKPVRLIIPFPPGGSNDVVGRMIATQMSERLGKQVVVDNRAGAGGVVGTELAANAPKDGYTVQIISIAHAVNPWLYKLPYDPIKSFTPISILASGPIRWILCTHTHVDHSPAAAVLKACTGATTFGMLARYPERQDPTFSPDVHLTHGERINVAGCTLRVLHTPGHASDHLCYYLVEERALFSGDVILNGSTSVIPAGDGDLGDYMASLRRLQSLDIRRIYPAHGPVIEDGPAKIQEYIDHRLARERQILEALGDGLRTIPDMVSRIYADVSPKLHRMAAMSVESHLRKLARDGRVREEIRPDAPSRWELLA